MKLDFNGSPIDYARSVTAAELKKKIRAIKAAPYDEYADRCRVCFERFVAGDIEKAEWWSKHAEAYDRRDTGEAE